MRAAVMRSPTPLRWAFASVLRTARSSMSIARTCDAPLSASWTPSSPVPQPMSRQRWWAPIAVLVEMAPGHQAADRRDDDARVRDEVGERQRVDRPPAPVGPCRRARRLVAEQSSGSGSDAPLAGRGLLEQLACRLDVGGADAAAAADDLRSLLAPAQRHRRVLLAADAGLEAPALVGVVAEVGIDAERQVGEVAQVGDHPVDVVRRDAVDHQGVDPELLELRRGASERVALGAAPVLPVDAAQAVPAAAKRQPHGKPGVQQRPDRLQERRPHDRQRLEQDEVGRFAREQPCEEPDRALALVGVHVAVDRERDRAAILALHPRLPLGEPGAAPAARGPSNASAASSARPRRRRAAGRSAAPTCSSR